MATQRHHIARELAAAAAAFSFTPPGAPQATPCKYSPFPSSRTISLITEDASATGTSHGKAKRGLAKESKLSLQVEAKSSTESNWFISWGITELRGAAQHGDEIAARRCSRCCTQPMSHCPQHYLLHPHSHSEHPRASHPSGASAPVQDPEERCPPASCQAEVSLQTFPCSIFIPVFPQKGGMLCF